MVVRLLSRLWEAGGLRRFGADSAPPDAGELASGEAPSRSRALRRRDEEHARQLHTQRRLTYRERAENESADELVEILLIAGALEQRQQDLLRDIDDAIAVARLAHEQALQDEQQAREALEHARDNALTLADGRRVYFSEDNQTLFDEDGRKIMDEPTLAEARSRLQAQPGATSYEAYARRSEDWSQANEKARELAEILDRLDDLERKAKNGRLTDDELARQRAELDRILAALPAEASEDYERLQTADNAAGRPPYWEADPAFEPASQLRRDFQQADEPKAPEPDATTETDPDRQPAYTQAPDF